MVSAVSQALAPPPGMLEQMRKFDANAQWAVEHAKALLEHVGKFVAVDGGRIVAVADSEDRIRSRLGKRPAAYVTFVHPPDMAWVL